MEPSHHFTLIIFKLMSYCLSSNPVAFLLHLMPINKSTCKNPLQSTQRKMSSPHLLIVSQKWMISCIWKTLPQCLKISRNHWGKCGFTDPIQVQILNMLTQCYKHSQLSISPLQFLVWRFFSLPLPAMRGKVGIMQQCNSAACNNWCG